MLWEGSYATSAMNSIDALTAESFNNTLHFRYFNATYAKFSKEYDSPTASYKEKEFWLGRKVVALPLALWSAVVKTIYHLVRAVLATLNICSNHRLPRVQAHVYSVARDLQEAWGWLTTIFSTKYGQYHIQESQFQKYCYEQFTDRIASGFEDEPVAIYNDLIEKQADRLIKTGNYLQAAKVIATIQGDDTLRDDKNWNLLHWLLINQCFNDVAEIVAIVQGNVSTTDVYRELMEMLIKAERFDVGLKVLANLPIDLHRRDALLKILAEGLIKTGHLDKAFKLLANSQFTIFLEPTLEKLAKAYISKGEGSSAFATIELIKLSPFSGNRDKSFIELANSLIAKQRANLPYSHADTSVVTTNTKIWGYHYLFDQNDRDNDFQKTRELPLVMDVIEAITNKSSRDNVWKKLFEICLDHNYHKYAKIIVDRFQSPHKQSQKDPFLTKIVEACIQAGIMAYYHYVNPPASPDLHNVDGDYMSKLNEALLIDQLKNKFLTLAKAKGEQAYAFICDHMMSDPAKIPLLKKLAQSYQMNGFSDLAGNIQKKIDAISPPPPKPTYYAPPPPKTNSGFPPYSNPYGAAPPKSTYGAPPPNSTSSFFSTPAKPYVDAKHYASLGLRATASHKEVKLAYKKLALRLHPDKQPPKQPRETDQAYNKRIEVATEKFKGLSTAYEELNKYFEELAKT